MFLSFLFSPFGAVAVLLLGLAFGHQYYKVHYMNKGEALVIEKSHTEGKKINAKIKKRTDAVTPDSAFGRLSRDYSRK